ncbi:MAG: hypothetical protein JNL08_05700 [Planctomycetes bacterium]|nr:hypothetical protein [Planctomycetota bacterium]
MRSSNKLVPALVLGALAAIGCATWSNPVDPAWKAHDTSTSIGSWRPPASLQEATAEREQKSSEGCLSCHQGIDSTNMHGRNVWKIGCADCHGGDPSVAWTGGAVQRPYPADYTKTMQSAHVQPAFPEEWLGSRNPERTYALLNRERLEYVRFINPGDLRVAPQTCGATGCHPEITARVMTSMMTHSAMVMGSGTYNNGVLPYKNYVIGEFYMPNGEAAIAKTTPPPTAAEKARGVVEQLIPVPRYNTSQPGNIFRAAERGQAKQRGLGTGARVDFAHFVLHKTRLNDPYVWFLGTNDYGGEFRSSGCTACHVLYANSEDPKMSAHAAPHGYLGTTDAKNGDPTIPKGEPGHPIQHRFTTQIPTSQCLTCHNHQGSGAIDNYAGLMWWDGESDGKLLYHGDGSPKKGAELADVHLEANRDAKHTQFSSQHRSGWSFRKVYKTNFEGQLVGKDGKLIDWSDKDWASKAVHLADHHYEVGMHCIDCHTEQDSHGDGKLYGEMINAVEIYCTDCHGTIAQRADLVTSNPAGGNRLLQSGKATDRRRQFRWVDAAGNDIGDRAPKKGDVLKQRSKVDPNLEWTVPQLTDVVDKTSPRYNAKAALAKTLQKGNDTWGDASKSNECYAHNSDEMTCYTCHTSWAISCAGCHLAGKTNRNRASSHFFGEKTLVDVGYYSQGLRSDCLMLGKNGDVKGNKISPIRSASAPIATAENGNRAIATHQQPTVSASGHSGHAFSPYIPHTVSAEHGQQCTSCHVSKADDNNAQLATRFNLGVHASDFVGTFVHLATTTGVTAVRVTDGWEPQPVIGSDFHAMTMPSEHAAHTANDGALTEAHTHSTPAVFAQARGEYLFTAAGKEGFRVLDIANIANKDVAQRIVSAPFSPIGHDTHVPSRDAAAIVLPTTVPTDGKRKVDPANKETPVHPLFSYAYVLDRQEGLITVDVDTMVDGDPDNNFLQRAATFNPNGALAGAHAGMVVGHFLYVLVPTGLAIVDIDDPKNPRLVRTVTQGLSQPRAIDVQFRYAAITDAQGMQVFDVTDLSNPVHVPSATVPLADARGVRLCRTYAYVAGGAEGLVIVDVRQFRAPKVVEKFTGDGAIVDATAVTTGLTNASMFAYVADGRGGLKVVEVWTPSRSHGTYGFSPRPTPRLVASYRTGGAAVGISTGMLRDRGVDESGNQIGVYGRIGSRPLNQTEREKFYLRNGTLYTVDDAATGYTEAK